MALASGISASWPILRHEDDGGADAVLLALLAEVGAPLPDRDEHVDRAVERVQAHRPGAAVDDRADVAGLEAVARDRLERRLADLLLRERDVHVVHLGRLEEPVDVVLVAEHRRAALGLVGADALEDAGAVVERVGQYVDLRVLPGDELAVHPDEVRLLHVSSSSTAASRFGGRCRAAQVGGPQTGLQGPIDGRFYPRRVVLPGESVPQHQRGREEHRERVGDPLAGDVGRRAVDGLEQAGPVAAEAALGSSPIEPVSIAASSERMSPNMFSVRITSKWRGAAMSCIAALSTSTCSSSTLGNSSAVHAHDDLAPQPAGLEHVGLVDARDARARGLEGDARDPLDLRRAL